MGPENQGFNFSLFQSTSILPNVFLTYPTILTHYYPGPESNTALQTTDIIDSPTH